jgi:hypothetical protein
MSGHRTTDYFAVKEKMQARAQEIGFVWCSVLQLSGCFLKSKAKAADKSVRPTREVSADPFI